MKIRPRVAYLLAKAGLGEGEKLSFKRQKVRWPKWVMGCYGVAMVSVIVGTATSLLVLYWVAADGLLVAFCGLAQARKRQRSESAR